MDVFEIDALGPIIIERIDDNYPPDFSATRDTGRIIYLQNIGSMWWGDGVNNKWIQINNSDLLSNHINSSVAHGSKGPIVGETTLSEHTMAVSAHNSNGAIVGTSSVVSLSEEITEHIQLTTDTHGANGTIVGLEDLRLISQSLEEHSLSRSEHGVSSPDIIAGIYNYDEALLRHKLGTPTHGVVTTGRSGFVPVLPMVETFYLNGAGGWTVPPSGGPGTSGSSGTPGRDNTSGTSGTAGRDRTSGTSGSAGTAGSSGSSAKSGSIIVSSTSFTVVVERNDASTKSLGSITLPTAGVYYITIYLGYYSQSQNSTTLIYVNNVTKGTVLKSGEDHGRQCFVINYSESITNLNLIVTSTFDTERIRDCSCTIQAIKIG